MSFATATAARCTSATRPTYGPVCARTSHRITVTPCPNSCASSRRSSTGCARARSKRSSTPVSWSRSFSPGSTRTERYGSGRVAGTPATAPARDHIHPAVHQPGRQQRDERKDANDGPEAIRAAREEHVRELGAREQARHACEHEHDEERQR